ncbi:uncharacterized protein KNAG_0L01380 [Huiozyma naganishii CBS 8797]|uniref:Arf-GAP domain-containing protein n=1 Tax=Huiozyma naganishii (strain ATCC MYA-139 / BCRC 22969 / CBS 8797 / KCTC 17520 / NBRC 10181 / NCYC 3082 / Yp74L-3) TaxID=1071383 RepID=J7RS80_HUIN7|nr:hypothetical protein KNAG_0L01380 [Kazachstania naganishii CBS 8797]CCK72758.1 hypothetical protein KNAG_0L01380 [Kazachstania naganishii CBS 8797]
MDAKGVLDGLLRDPGNAKCADCKVQAHPRWASWSLGVFLCIGCAGVHRSLGTHISKVKSVDLDAWQSENLEVLVRNGSNVRANALLYETKLTEPWDLGDDDDLLKQFIKCKYELRKWCSDCTVLDQPQPTSKVETETAPPETAAETAAVITPQENPRRRSESYGSKSDRPSLVNLQSLKDKKQEHSPRSSNNKATGGSSHSFEGRYTIYTRTRNCQGRRDEVGIYIYIHALTLTT